MENVIEYKSNKDHMLFRAIWIKQKDCTFDNLCFYSGDEKLEILQKYWFLDEFK